MSGRADPQDPAETYERVFVPALFGPWAEVTAAVADLSPGHRVLDLACGTGILARTIHESLDGRAGRIVGLDANEGMLAAAARRNPRIEWTHGPAERLPFADGAFDRVVSQFGWMFFEDRVAALHECWRVLARDGRLVVAVWDSIESSPGYVALVDLVLRTLGNAAAEALRVPFCLGQPGPLDALFRSAGIEAGIQTHPGTVRFSSIRDWITADVQGWISMFVPVSRSDFAGILAEAERELSAFTDEQGAVAFPIQAHLVVADRA